MMDRRMRFWLIGIAIFVVALYLLRGILLPFVAGMALAYFLDPVCDWLERRGLSRSWATAIVAFCFLLVLAIVLLIVIPPLQRQTVALATELPNYIRELAELLQPFLDRIRDRLPSADSPLPSNVGEQAGAVIGWVIGALGNVLSGGLAFFNLISLLVITPIVAIYLLRDWDRFTQRLDAWLPRDQADTIRAQLREVDRTLAGFVRGQATVCLCLATIYGGGFSLVGLDFGLALGLFAGVLSFIPFVGSGVAFIGSVILALLQFPDWTHVLLVVAVCVVGQVLEGYVLTPKLVGDRVGLHPVWVIFALLAGGALFGFVGVLIALPVAAVCGVLVRFALLQYLGSGYYRGRHAPPTAPSDPV